MRYILVSACLLGANCRYNGEPKANASALELLQDNDLCLIPVCPEQMGGLPTPRYPSEKRAQKVCVGDSAEGCSWNQRRNVSDAGCSLNQEEHGEFSVINDHGMDVTENYVRGAREALRMANLYGCRAALLKERSPSCGRGEIYDGSFSRTLIPGNGVAADLLLSHGIKVFGESQIPALRKWLQERSNDGKIEGVNNSIEEM